MDIFHGIIVVSREPAIQKSCCKLLDLSDAVNINEISNLLLVATEDEACYILTWHLFFCVLSYRELWLVVNTSSTYLMCEL